ncbi:CoA-disulfide reductase [Paenibacillus sediminis]|uniref:CoA-disulfide reductase n=1 Tax=Paenibacillus sediminis TaxID=664909 RepID=A0ABS4H014_9BACL|nr:CoA-disulfide reductase [Paenibacillus sediminis]MBP1935868.1 CoA-disulfide reductase [Paenibacillus sediminis]
MKRKIVIVGGVAGGAAAAARLRRLNEEDDIIMFERGEYVSFANCGLPYYIGEKIQARGKLLVQTVEGLNKRFKLDVRNFSEVISIDRANKKVRVRNVKDGTEYEESYDYLILAPGAKPIVPDIAGIREAANVFTLRNIADTDAITAFIKTTNPNRAVIIGGGAIGLEMAENLRVRGLDVTLIEASEQVMGPLDPEMAQMVHEHMVGHGVELILKDGVSAIEEEGHMVKLQSGRNVEADLIILAIGVQPESTLAKDAGLKLGVRGSIVVNKQLQTSDPNIYAVGDAIEVTDKINGQPTVVTLAWGASRQGRLVADHINGLPVHFGGLQGTAIAKVFDLTVAMTGNNEKTLRKYGMPYRTVHVHPASHASYYPNAAPIALKLLFHPENGTILGAQAVALDGADKRIDVIATAMKGGLTVYDLPDLELAYAPPFSSSKDPVNIAGYAASNIMDGLVETVQWYEIDELVKAGALLIDVRDPKEREAGYIEGSVNIPLNDLRERIDELPKDREIYVSCQVGLRGYLAARLLSGYGIKAKNVDGGYKTYYYGIASLHNCSK